MRVEEALRTVVLRHPPVAALAGTRMMRAPLRNGTTLPALTYERIGGGPDHDIEGATRSTETLIQVNAWGATYDAASDLAYAVAELSGVRQVVGDCQIIPYVENVIDEIEATSERHYVMVQFRVMQEGS